MNELIEKVENLKNSLDETKEVQEIKNFNEKIMQDKELLADIKKYNETQDEKLKEKIINNKLFREYKKKETDLNLIILKINNHLKEITNKGKCGI